VEHNKIPRGQRGNYSKIFCRKYGIAEWNIGRVYRPYRMAFLELKPYSRKAREYFESFERNEIGSNELRILANGLYDPHAVQMNQIPANVQRNAILQILEYLDRIQLVISKIDGELSAEITDEEVVEWVKRVHQTRGSLTSWLNRRVKRPRASAFTKHNTGKEGETS
jgi:hypothetical protein